MLKKSQINEYSDKWLVTCKLWGFEEREKLLKFYERVLWARMHAN